MTLALRPSTSTQTYVQPDPPKSKIRISQEFTEPSADSSVSSSSRVAIPPGFSTVLANSRLFSGVVGEFLEIDDWARLEAVSHLAQAAVLFCRSQHPFLEDVSDSARPLSLKGPGPLPDFHPHLRSRLLEYRSALDDKNVTILKRYAKHLGFQAAFFEMSMSNELIKTSYFYSLCDRLTRMSFPPVYLNTWQDLRNAFMTVIHQRNRVGKKFQNVKCLNFTAPITIPVRQSDAITPKEWKASLEMHKLAANVFPNLTKMKVSCPGGTLWNQRICEEWLSRLENLTISNAGYMSTCVIDELPKAARESYPLRFLKFHNCLHIGLGCLLRKTPHLESLRILNDDGMGKIVLKQYFSDAMLKQLRASCPNLARLCVGILNTRNIKREIRKVVATTTAFPLRDLSVLFSKISTGELIQFQRCFGARLYFEVRFLTSQAGSEEEVQIRKAVEGFQTSPIALADTSSSSSKNSAAP